jgi:SH3-like domain-containing protein
VETLNKEFASAKKVTPYKVTVRPTRASGWVNMRWAPSQSAELMATYKANDQLLVIRELTNWLQVEDQDTGDVGFINKAFIAD